MRRILDFRFLILDYRPNPKSKIQNLKYLSGTALLIAVLLRCSWSADACPGCKEALFDPGQLAQKLSTARGYAISIGLLLAVPFTLVAGMTALIVRAARRR